MTEFLEEIGSNHTLHGVALGGLTYYILSKNKNDKALRYGVVVGVLSAMYMKRFGHTADGFTAGENMLSSFTKEFAQLTAT